MFKLFMTLLTGALIGVSTQALAERTTKDAYKAEKDRIKAEYKADKDRCASLKANAKDICKAEAKAKEKIAKADAEAAYKGTAKARADAQVVRAKAEYDVAKEKCDDLSGNAKSVCKKEAKASMTKGKADGKANRQISEVRKDAAEDKREAEYAVAKERCNALSGDAKAQCQKDAKARFGKS